jgi:hypothetical protein
MKLGVSSKALQDLIWLDLMKIMSHSQGAAAKANPNSKLGVKLPGEPI